MYKDMSLNMGEGYVFKFTNQFPTIFQPSWKLKNIDVVFISIPINENFGISENSNAIQFKVMGKVKHQPEIHKLTLWVCARSASLL